MMNPAYRGALLAVLSVGLWGAMHYEATAAPLHVSAANSRYFADDSGKAVYLTGSHNWYNLQDPGGTNPAAAFDFNAHLDFLEAHNHNFIRLWRFEDTSINALPWIDGPSWGPHPWARTGPGTATDGLPKFDFTQLNQPYFDRLRDRVEAASDRGIYVSIMLYEGYGLRVWPWTNSLFNAANNINGINGDPNGDNRGYETHRLPLPTGVQAIQEAYVRKVIDTVHDLDNVLFEVANEDGNGSLAWQEQVIAQVRNYESSTYGIRHPVGMTLRQMSGTTAELFNSSADWISPGASWAGKNYTTNPPANNGGKVVISDTDHLWGYGGDRDWVWKTFTRGLNPIYMDPLDTDATQEGARQAMGDTRHFAELLKDLAAMTPQDAGTTPSSSNYSLFKTGESAEYLAYLPSGSSLTMNLSGATGQLLTVEWFNTVAGQTFTGANVQGGGSNVLLTAPSNGAWALHLVAVPEPASAVLLAIGIAVVVLAGSRRKKTAAHP